MSIDAGQLMRVGVAYPLAVDLKTQIEAEDAAQRDAWTCQSAVAATGSVLSQALATTGDIVHVYSSYASMNDGVALRTGTSTKRRQIVINRGGANLKVYPPSATGNIDALAAGVGAVLSNGQQAQFWCINTTTQEFIGKY